MKITRDVITDLLPAYLSGEASADTRAMVEEFLKSDPEFAQQARSAQRPDLLRAAPVSLPPGQERIALARTKSLLRRRTWLLALALFFTAFPFSFVAESERGLVWMMLRDFPAGAAASGVLALLCWAGYVMTHHRLRPTGL